MVVSSEEITNEKLNNNTLRLAVQEIQEVGYVVLERVLPKAWVAELRIAFERELLKLVDGNPPQTHGGGSPPMEDPFLDQLIIAHPLAVQIEKRSAAGAGFPGQEPGGDRVLRRSDGHPRHRRWQTRPTGKFGIWHERSPGVGRPRPSGVLEQGPPARDALRRWRRSQPGLFREVTLRKKLRGADMNVAVPARRSCVT